VVQWLGGSFMERVLRPLFRLTWKLKMRWGSPPVFYSMPLCSCQTCVSDLQAAELLLAVLAAWMFPARWSSPLAAHVVRMPTCGAALFAAHELAVDEKGLHMPWVLGI